MKTTLNLKIAALVFLFFCLSGPWMLYPVVKFGFIERIRFEGWDNTVGLSETANDATAYLRVRTSVMAQWFPNPDIELTVKLTNEFRNYFSPKTTPFKINEVFFDYLYAKWKNVGKLPLTLTVGRQDITLGEGFVVMDGGPIDGSRSIYFNAVRADYNIDANHRLTTFVNYEPATDTILPLFNPLDPDQFLIESPEFGAGAYYTGKFNKSVFEAYAIYKAERKSVKRPIKSGIQTLGARVTQPFTPRLSLTAEGAYQFGKHGDAAISAFGGYFHLDYRLEKLAPLLQTVTLGGIYLGGDNPNTAKFEGWNPLFSRWPKWSDSFIYTFIRENGVAYWSNYNTLYISLLAKLVDSTTLRLTWSHLTANALNPGFSLAGTGKTRGDLIVGKLEFALNKYTTGRFIFEHFKPGNYYFNGADSANWLQFELTFKIQ